MAKVLAFLCIIVLMYNSMPPTNRVEANQPAKKAKTSSQQGPKAQGNVNVPLSGRATSNVLPNSNIQTGVVNLPSGARAANNLQGTNPIMANLGRTISIPAGNRITDTNNENSGSGMALNRAETNSGTTRSSSKKTKRCRILLNEVFTGQNFENEEQFIELMRHCPSEVPTPASETLNGVVVFAISLKHDPVILLAARLDRKHLAVKEKRTPVVGEKIHLFGIGTSHNKDFDMQFGLIQSNTQQKPNLQYKGHPAIHNILPNEGRDPVILLVVHTAAKDSNQFWAKFTFGKATVQNSQVTQELPLSPQLKAAITAERIDDFVVYGGEVNDFAQNLVREITNDENYDLSKSMLSMKTSVEIKNTKLSYSRCDNKPFSTEGFKFVEPTPMADNVCDDRPRFTLFSLRRQRLHRDAQKLIINVVYSITNSRGSTDLYVGTPAEVASRLLGLQKKTVDRYVSQASECNILTPRRGPVRQRVRETIDSFDRDKIRELISASYRRGQPAFANLIYNSFKDYKNGIAPVNLAHDTSNSNQSPPLTTTTTKSPETEPECSEKLDSIPAESSNTGTQFKCSFSTFTRILHEMGFTYGKINDRIGIMQRWDLAVWRAKFIKALDENDKSPNPMKVTYLDETWLNPFAKWDKGWRLKNPANTKEALKYAYGGNIKIGSGPRLIILAAADNDGVIKESIKIRRIDTKDVTEDYHDNVGRDEFMSWFRKLLDYYDSKDEKHIIVIDNASYHSTMQAPKSTTKKADLISWLEDLRKNPNFAPKIPQTAGRLRWELWDEVQRLKKDPEIQSTLYEVDKLASERGHRILRNSPYHCHLNPIEQVWSVVKGNARKRNLMQNVTVTMDIVRQELENYSKESWKNQLAHAKKLRDAAWEEDKVLDNQVSQLIIPLTDDDDQDDENDSGGEEDITDSQIPNKEAEACVAEADWDNVHFETYEDYLKDQEEHRASNQEALDWVASLGPAPSWARGRQPCSRKRLFVATDGNY